MYRRQIKTPHTSMVVIDSPRAGAVGRGADELAGVRSSRSNEEANPVIWCGLGCLAMLVFAAAGSIGSMDPVAQALIRQMAHGASNAKPGDWISYRTDAGGGRVSFWRLSAVGAEKDALGRDALWIEVELGHHDDLRAPLLQMKMLVSRAEGSAAKGVTRLFVALGADPPQEISADQLPRLWHLLPVTAPSRSVRSGEIRDELASADEIIRTGEEARLMTQAGTLPAIPVEIYQRGSLIERIWISHRLPLLGLAKLEIPSIGHAMEVTGFGNDAAPRMILPERVDPKIRLDRQVSAGGP